MKIAFIIETWPSKNQIPIINQIVEINKQGNNATTFFAFNTKLKNIKDLPEDILKYNLDRNIIELKSPPLSKYKNRFIRKLNLFLSSIPYIVRTLFLSPKILFKSIFKKDYGEYKKAFKIIFAIQNLLKKNYKFDAIICQFAPLGNWGAIFSDLGIIQGKLVTTFRGYGINDLPNQKPTNFYTFLIEKCNIFTSNTNYTKKNAVKLGFPEQKIHIIHTATNINKYIYKERHLEKGKTFNILTAAALKEVKGIEYAIKAMKIVVKNNQGIDIKFRIAGEGTLKTKLTKLIKQENLENYIELLGFVNHDELIKIYAETHLFVLPSVTTKNGNQEAQGLVLQEAQACGIPVIGTNTGGIPEGFINEKSGFVVEEKNPQAIAEKILFFIKNPIKLIEFGKIGHKFVSEKFNIHSETMKLLKVLNNA